MEIKVLSDTSRIDGDLHVEEFTFTENGMLCTIERTTFADGSSKVQLTQGDKVEIIDIEKQIQNESIMPNMARTNYPVTVDWWFARTDEFSSKFTSFTVAAIAAVVAGSSGVPVSNCLSIASSIYYALNEVSGTLYFVQDVWYKTVQDSPISVVWHNKFIVTTYSDSAHRYYVSGPDTTIYKSTYPM